MSRALWLSVIWWKCSVFCSVLESNRVRVLFDSKMGTLITFKDRSAEDYINKQIIEVFRTCEGPDVDLIVTGGKVVSAHRVILSMYSKYLRRILSESNPEPKFVGNWSFVFKILLIVFENGRLIIEIYSKNNYISNCFFYIFLFDFLLEWIFCCKRKIAKFLHNFSWFSFFQFASAVENIDNDRRSICCRAVLLWRNSYNYCPQKSGEEGVGFFGSRLLHAECSHKQCPAAASNIECQRSKQNNCRAKW